LNYLFERGSVSLNKGGGVRGAVRSGEGFWCGGDLDSNAIITGAVDAVVAEIGPW